MSSYAYEIVVLYCTLKPNFFMYIYLANDILPFPFSVLAITASPTSHASGTMSSSIALPEGVVSECVCFCICCNKMVKHIFYHCIGIAYPERNTEHILIPSVECMQHKHNIHLVQKYECVPCRAVQHTHV